MQRNRTHDPENNHAKNPLNHVAYRHEQKTGTKTRGFGMSSAKVRDRNAEEHVAKIVKLNKKSQFLRKQNKKLNALKVENTKFNFISLTNLHDTAKSGSGELESTLDS